MYIITYGLVWMMLFCHKWGYSWKSLQYSKWGDSWKSLLYCITSDQNIVTDSNPYNDLFLACYDVSWTHESLKTIIDHSFCHCHQGVSNTGFIMVGSIKTISHLCYQGGSSLTWHFDVTTVDLWHHTNTTWWHCDVTFIVRSCTHKLAKSLSLLVNNNHEYRFPTTYYSWFSV